MRKSITPGRLYKSIIIEKGLIEEEPKKLRKQKENWFVRFCKKCYAKFPSLAGKAQISEQHAAALTFLNWNLNAKEFSCGINTILLLSLGASILAWLVLNTLGAFEMLSFIAYGNMLALLLFVLLALWIFRFFYMYPITMAYTEQKRALGYIPEIVGYMVMSLKLTPNLEKAVEFAANHGSGKIAEEFRKLLWDVEVGIYATVAEGLDEIAYRWGLFAPEFKRALMRIRASILEDSEAKRDSVLNKTMDELLASIRERMEEFAASIKQPSIALFFTGVLLPLILMVVLPIGSVFSGIALANPLAVAMLYNVLIPLAAFASARAIIKRRPPTRELPEISDKFLGKKSKWHVHIAGKTTDIRIAVIIVALLGFLISYYFHLNGLAIPLGTETLTLIPADRTEEQVLDARGLERNYFEIPNGLLYRQYYLMYREQYKNDKIAKEKAEAKVLLEKKRFFLQRENEVTPYVLYFGTLITLALCIFIWFYYTNNEKYRAQQEVINMESEFKDAIYVVASRLGEHKPMEEAIRYVKEFLPKSAIAEKLFGKIQDNIALLGMPLESAVFDSRFGAVAKIPSKIIRTAMRVVIDASKLGTTIAARTLVALALQLDNMERVEKMLKALISDITTTMRTLAIIIAPIVLGITTTLYKVVILTIANISAQSQSFVGAELELNVPTEYSHLRNIIEPITKVRKGFLQPEALAGLSEPIHFITVTAIYLIEICLIILYFSAIIEDNNKLRFKMHVAKYLPLAIVIYAITVITTNAIVSVMMGA